MKVVYESISEEIIKKVAEAEAAGRKVKRIELTIKEWYLLCDEVGYSTLYPISPVGFSHPPFFNGVPIKVLPPEIPR